MFCESACVGCWLEGMISCTQDGKKIVIQTGACMLPERQKKKKKKKKKKGWKSSQDICLLLQGSFADKSHLLLGVNSV